LDWIDRKHVGESKPLRRMFAYWREWWQRRQELRNLWADIQHVAPGQMRDLERTCACCDEKRICKQDLTDRPSARVWKDYCPNAISLTSSRDAKEPLRV
jgi:hypothetical protein